MRWSLLPLAHMLRSRLTRSPARALTSAATRAWQIAPAHEAMVPRACFLPGQLERVTGWAFTSEHPGREMQGGTTVVHGPTRGFLIEDAWLLDGVLYKRTACAHLHPRSRRWPRIVAQHEIERAAVYCTPGGNAYFGTWLGEDCPTYALAEAEGTPVTTAQPIGAHARDYESLLEMRPRRHDAVYLRQVVVFDDVGQNRDKHRRFRAMHDKLAAHVQAGPHPGVFIVRGEAGARRVLRGELDLAEHLRATRGFRILDPMHVDVPTIVRTCAGARCVVGVEGSALVHGMLMLPPGASVLTLQPPDRFVNVLKHLADRDGQRFGFVVGQPDGRDFRVGIAEVERTLDLLEAAP